MFYTIAETTSLERRQHFAHAEIGFAKVVAYCLQSSYRGGRLDHPTEEFDRWLRRLRDLRAKMRIVRFFERVQIGGALTGDFKMVRPKIVEVRFNFGHGYKVYLTPEGNDLVLLLLGVTSPPRIATLTRQKGWQGNGESQRDDYGRI